MTNDKALLKLAMDAMERAYAPYSGYRVGACLLAGDGRTFMGCNVENAAYGQSICAERGALMNALAAGAREFEAIAVTAEKSQPWPCGACRQMLNEFAPQLRVTVMQAGYEPLTTVLDALLPHAFGPGNLVEDTIK